MKTEEWFCFRQLGTVEGETEERLLVPHADPFEFENVIDGLFPSIEQAEQYLFEMRESGELDEKETLVICKMVLTPIKEV